MFGNILFVLSALLTVASSLMVVITRDIMHACVFLLGTLLGMAGLYLCLGADFVAATQIMVYVGGVVILMLFAVMLTGGKNILQFARSGETRFPLMGNMKTYTFGVVAAGVFVLSIVHLVWGMLKLGEAAQGAGPRSSTVEEIGRLFLTDHVLAFEMSSVLLLGALIGAAIIARARS